MTIIHRNSFSQELHAYSCDVYMQYVVFLALHCHYNADWSHCSRQFNASGRLNRLERLHNRLETILQKVVKYSGILWAVWLMCVICVISLVSTISHFILQFRSWCAVVVIITQVLIFVYFQCSMPKHQSRVTIPTINSIHAHAHALLPTHTLPICIPHRLAHPWHRQT